MIFVKKTGFSAKILKKQRLNSTKVTDQKNLDSQDLSAGITHSVLKEEISFIKLLNISIFWFIAPDSTALLILDIGSREMLFSLP